MSSLIDLDPAALTARRTELHPDRYSPAIPDSIQFHLNKELGCVNSRDITADVFTPKAMPLVPRPAIVFLHGGCWRFGDPSQFHAYSAYLAEKHDFFAISVDYRLSDEARFPAALHDAKCAIRWVRSLADEFKIDPNRIAIAGGSAGAHLASMVATTAGVEEYEGKGGHNEFSSHVNLAILFNGEFDMWDLVNKGSLIDDMEQFIGGIPTEVPEKYDELSTVKRIHPNVPPVLFLHGTEDECVSHEQSIAFYDRLVANGIHAEIEIYQGKPHAWFNFEPDRANTLRRMEKFLVAQFNL